MSYYILYTAYDDNTADILDLETLQIQFMEESELIKIGSNNHVLGLAIADRKVYRMIPFSYVEFPNNGEAYAYMTENNISTNNHIYMHDRHYVLTETNNRFHVDYFICTYRGDEVSYIHQSGKGYTPYIQAAKAFDKKTAKRKAAMMTKNSKTGTYWTTQRVVNN